MHTRQELDCLREQAIMLRRQGKSLRQIKEILGPMSNAALYLKIEGWAAAAMSSSACRSRSAQTS
jgi:hypothetical protein